MSKIEWTEKTWNPVTGCTKISEGCRNCYAEKFAERWRGIPGHAYEQGFDLKLHPSRLTDPFRWKKPRMIFVNSMSDLFHEDIPLHFIIQVFGVMQQAPNHTFQILTKRPERMKGILSSRSFQRLVIESGCQHSEDSDGAHSWALAQPWPLKNVWLGVSVEDQFSSFSRLSELRDTPAVVRFISCEPLLEFVSLELLGIDWVIVGGESGPGARPMEPAWARMIRDKCRVVQVPFFMKQMGGKQDKRGRLINLPEDLRIREMPLIKN